MTHRFKDLVGSLCMLTGMVESSFHINGTPVSVDGVLFSLLADPGDADRMFLYATFGAVPKEKTLSVMEQLLKLNHAEFSGNGPGFAISPTTGNVVYCKHLDLADMTARGLASLMASIAAHANEWRKTYFLDEAKRPGRISGVAGVLASRKAGFKNVC